MEIQIQLLLKLNVNVLPSAVNYYNHSNTTLVKVKSKLAVEVIEPFQNSNTTLVKVK